MFYNITNQSVWGKGLKPEYPAVNQMSNPDKVPQKPHATDERELLRFLHCSSAGLSEDEAGKRLGKYGPNSLTPPRKEGPLQRLFRQIHQPLIYILLASTLITALLEEWVDASVILGVVVVNTLIGYLQEAKALQAIEALAREMTTTATVIRDGEKRRIPATQLVPGDIVLLEAGDRVPADLRLLQVRNLQVDESALTGESIPVEKEAGTVPADTPLADRSNMVYSSTLVTQGTARGVVVATGDHTELGRISELISTTEVLATPLTRKINRFSHLLLYVILIMAAVTFLVGTLRGESWFNMFMASVALAVGAIPEGLPAAVTITLAIGVARMARRNAIIRHLPAVETLGSTTVICSDKTGTLTQNQMTVQEILAGNERFQVTGLGYDPHGEILHDDQRVEAGAWPALEAILRAGVLCNDSQWKKGPEGWIIEGDPTEGALLVAAHKGGQSIKQLRETWPRLDAIPFESQFQYMATLHDQGPNKPHLVYLKGSVESLLPRCINALGSDGSLVELNAGEIEDQVQNMALRGLRVLAFAQIEFPAEMEMLCHENVESGLTFLGLQGMIDPPRPEATASVRACRNAGIRVKMITGDHPGTAAAIADQIGLDGFQQGREEVPVITGAALAGLSPEELVETAENTVVFARVSPEQKLRLVEALQRRDHVVAMTGDGVNDAPALRRADIGVAMGIAGTEVAKEAADMILTDDNFASIRAAVEEGRGVYDNLIKFITWTLPTNLGEGLVIMAAVFTGVALPILPVQILWINMTTAVLLGLMLAFEPKEPDIMQRPPRDPHRPILSRRLLLRIGIVGTLLLAGAFGLFEWALANGASEAEARTIAVNVFVCGELFYLFNCRSLTRSMFTLGVFSNRWLIGGVLLMIALQLLFTYAPFMNIAFSSTPLALSAWGPILLVGAAIYTVVGIEKWLQKQQTDPA